MLYNNKHYHLLTLALIMLGAGSIVGTPLPAKADKCTFEGVAPGCCGKCTIRGSRLVYDCLPTGVGGKAPRHGTCPDGIPQGRQLNYHPQTTQHTLIYNNGKPSIEESVYIDATDGGYSMDTLSGEFPIRPNGAATGQAMAVPTAWRGFETSFGASSVYGPSTYNSANTPIYGTFHKSTGETSKVKPKPYTFKEFEKAAMGNGNSEYNKMVNHFKGHNPTPMNQNRIQTYMDIYEAYVLATDSETKATVENKALQESLKNLTTKANQQAKGGFYNVVAGMMNPMTNKEYDENTDLSDPTAMDALYRTNKERMDYFFSAAYSALEQAQKIIADNNINVAEGKPYDEAYKDFQAGLISAQKRDPDKGELLPLSPAKGGQQFERLAKLYMVLYYFGGGEFGGVTEDVAYKPDPAKIDQAMSMLSEENAPEVGAKIERVKPDGKFAIPQKPDFIKSLASGKTSRTVESSVEYKDFPTIEEKSYMQIGMLSTLPKEVSENSVEYLERDRVDIKGRKHSLRTDIADQLKKEREARLAVASIALENRATWGNALKKEWEDTPAWSNFTDYNLATLANFDTSTCMMKPRHAASRPQP